MCSVKKYCLVWRFYQVLFISGGEKIRTHEVPESVFDSQYG